MLLRVNVDNPADKITEFGAGAKLYWARDNTTAAGAFTDASGNVTLVAGTTQYEIIDTTGAVGHFYRTRIGNTGGTLFDTWSPVFQAGAPQTYGTLDALRERVRQPDNTRDNLLSDLLLSVTKRINGELGFDFFRHPAVSGTEVVLYDGRGSRTIHDQQGFQSVSAIRFAPYTGGSYTALAVTEWFLRSPASPSGPWLELELNDRGMYRYTYYGLGTVEVTGVRGYLSIPADVEEAALQWAADLYFIDSGRSALGESRFGTIGLGGGGLVGESTSNTFVGGMPRFTWEVVKDYKSRHNMALVA